MWISRTRIPTTLRGNTGQLHHVLTAEIIPASWVTWLQSMNCNRRNVNSFFDNATDDLVLCAMRLNDFCGMRSELAPILLNFFSSVSKWRPLTYFVLRDDILVDLSSLLLL
jgi:hypothetical protein